MAHGSDKRRRSGLAHYFTAGSPPTTARGWRRFHRLSKPEQVVRAARWDHAPSRRMSMAECMASLRPTAA